MMIRAAFLAIVLAAPVAAQDIRIETPVLRVASPVSKTGAGYLVICNAGRTADTLLSVTTTASTRSDIHGTIQSGGVMKMRAQEGGVPIAPGARVLFAPGGLHIMFIGLKKPVPPGTKVPARLTFARAGVMDVVFTAEGFSPTGG